MVCVLLSVFTGTGLLHAQQRTATDTILLGMVTEEGIGIPMVFLDEVAIKARLPKKWVKRQEEYNRLKYNVYKVYPYAVIAADVLQDVHAHLETIPGKKAQKAYMKSVELELKKRFKGELENLTISQGQVLVKLINRQTGRNCFSIIKEVKGGFSAVVYQSVAMLFSNNLRKEYDPEGHDRDMEAIVQELEATNYYRHYYYKQQRVQSKSANNN